MDSVDFCRVCETAFREVAPDAARFLANIRVVQSDLPPPASMRVSAVHSPLGDQRRPKTQDLAGSEVCFSSSGLIRRPDPGLEYR
jgi:hypothetical protein